MFTEFLTEQWPIILTVVIIFITLLTLFAILGINFNPHKNKIIQKEVIVESFNDNNNDDKKTLSDDFCTQFSSQSDVLNKQCNKLTEHNCNTTGCCVWLNGKQCVAGNERGPTFLTSKTDKKTAVDVDVAYYYYKDKCFGKGCPKGNPGLFHLP
jgi:hypothetical protein